MTTSSDSDPDRVELHKRAEDELEQQEGSAPTLQMDATRMLHEMRVHQIEIEMENASLRQMQSEAREALAQVGVMAEDQLRMHYPGAHILFVRTEPPGEDAARVLLESIGMKVDVAGSASSALDLAKGGEYALLLLDASGSGLNSSELVQILSAIPGREGVPIVVMDQNRSGPAVAGVSGYAGIPLNPAQLFGTMLHCLARRGR